MRNRSLLVVPVVAVAALAGCSSEDSSSAGDAGSIEAPQAEVAEREAADRAPVSSADQPPGRSTPADPVRRQVIHRGEVSLRSDDVAATVADVQRLAGEHGGQVSEQRTATDDAGEAESARLVLRIPSAAFAEAFAALEDVAELRSSSATEEDVTTQVIDTRVRVRAQRRSLRRVEVLLDRATTIRDVVAIEAQLTRRQAALDSLEQRLAFLTDQTAMSTVTVEVGRAAVDAPREEEEDEDSGFAAGLSAGWTALGVLATGLATVAGAALPFAAVVAVLALPVLLALRRARRRAAPADA